MMLKRERLTQEEYDKAMATPLVFVKDGTRDRGGLPEARQEGDQERALDEPVEGS